MDAVRAVCKSLEKPTADAILASEDYKKLSEPEQLQFTRIAGAVLYDPTILYR